MNMHSGGRKPALRRLLHKVCQIDNSKDSSSGCREEAFWRKQTYRWTGSQAKAQQILEDPDPETTTDKGDIR